MENEAGADGANGTELEAQSGHSAENAKDYQENTDAEQSLYEEESRAGRRSPRQEEEEKRDRSENESIPPVNEEDIASRIQQLREDMLQLESESRYVEAEEVRQELVVLKAEYNRFDHKSLDEAQQMNFEVFWHDADEQKEAFEAQWDRRLAEQRRRAHMLIDNLRGKHELQQQKLFDVIQRKNYVPKFSTQLLSMRNKQLVLGKAQKYVEAEALRKQADRLEAAELDRMRRKAKEDNQLRFNNLLIKQQWERSNLKDKLLAEKQQIIEAKKRAYNELRQRIQNKLANMKKWQTREKMWAKNLLPPVLKESLERRSVPTNDSEAVTPNGRLEPLHSSKRGSATRHANSPPNLRALEAADNVYGSQGPLSSRTEHSESGRSGKTSQKHSQSSRRAHGTSQRKTSRGKPSVRQLAMQHGASG